jgi:hypothetical protein
MTAARPDYVQAPNRAVGFGPYVQTGGWLHTFCVRGDREKIDAFLHAMFAAPSGGAVVYEAVTAQLFVSFARFAQVRADGAADRGRGVIPESDVAVWALARRRGGPLFDFVWIPLFLFVDDSSAMATGREVYGFPKQIGRIKLPETAPPSDGPFSVEAVVLDPFAPDTVARRAPLFEFHRSRAADPVAEAESVAGRLLVRLASTLVEAEREALGKALGGSAPFLDMPVTMAFLKQFPDTADPTKACFQAIVEAKARTRKVNGANWTEGHFEGRVWSYDSHPFAEALGIASGLHDVGPALWASFDFVMELGREIWTAD